MSCPRLSAPSAWSTRIILALAAMAAMVAPSGCSALDREPPCSPGELSVYLYYEAFDPGLLSGPATIADHQAGTSITLAFDSGDTMDLRYQVGSHELPVTVGQRVEAYVDVQMPFWTETMMVLRQPGPSGALIAAVWDTSGAVPPGTELAGLTVSYGVAQCGATDDGCGERVGLELEVPLGEEEPAILVAAGTEVVDGGMRMGNGRASGRFIGQVQCTDTPTDWTAGYLLAGP